MKVYLLDVYRRGPRYFLDEKSLISYLNNDRNRREPIGNYQVKVIEGEIEHQSDGHSYLETYEKTTREKNLRDSKLNSVLGDEYAIAVDKFLTFLKKNAKDDFAKKSFLKAAELTPVEKKQFSKFIANCADYLLYQVSDTVEYYKLILAVHNFRKINDRYSKPIYQTNGLIRHYNNVVTSESNKKNFLIAKSK